MDFFVSIFCSSSEEVVRSSYYIKDVFSFISWEEAYGFGYFLGDEFQVLKKILPRIIFLSIIINFLYIFFLNG